MDSNAYKEISHELIQVIREKRKNESKTDKAEARKNIDRSIIDEHITPYGYDELLPDALTVFVEAGTCSATLLQQKLNLDFSHSMRIMNQLEELRLITPSDGQNPQRLYFRDDVWKKWSTAFLTATRIQELSEVFKAIREKNNEN